MSDERVRALERAWRKSGLWQDEAVWLRERVRCGDLAPERVTFPGNPWPKGHRVKRLVWSGRLEETGVWFDLHLETVDYDADDRPGADEDEEDADDDWSAKGCWTNYHACTVSSTEWGGQGFLVGTADAKLDLATLGAREFAVDPVPRGADASALDPDALAFNAYLLGHDTVADHRLRFALREDATTFWLSWRARIALTYAGRDELAHELVLPLRRVRLRGLTVPRGLREAAAREQLARFVADPDTWRVARIAGERRFVPGPPGPARPPAKATRATPARAAKRRSR